METNNNHTDNSSLGELLTAYYSNGLSSSEKIQLETQAASDPFLADAMEGFNEFPQAINEVPNFNPKSSNAGWITIAGITILGLIGAFIYFGSPQDPKHNEINPVGQVENTKEETNKTVIDSKSEPVETNTTKIENQSTVNKKEQLSPTIDNAISPEPVVREKRETFALPRIDLSLKEIKQKQDDQAKKARIKSIAFNGFILVDYSLIYSNTIPVKTQLSGTDASQSNKSDPSIIPDNSVSTTHYSYKDYLKNTCKLMKERKFIPAIRNFKTILSHFPHDVNAEFYLGYCYYELGKFDKAILFFDEAMNNGFDFFMEDSQWLKANSLENLGRTKEAQKIYKEIKNNGGFYSSKLR